MHKAFDPDGYNSIPVRTLQAIVFALLSLVLLLPNFRSPVNVFDESFYSVGASMILDGKVPYRDFWLHYPPGQHYSVAAIGRVFGESITFYRIYDTLTRFGIVLVAFVICRTHLSAKLSIATSLVLAFYLGSSSFALYAIYPAILLLLVTSFFLIRYSKSGAALHLLLAAIATGATSFYRYDFAAYALFAGTASLLFLWIAQRSRERRAKTVIPALRAILLYTLPALTISVLGYASLALAVGAETLLQEVFIFPLFVLPLYRHLPVPLPWRPLGVFGAESLTIFGRINQFGSWAQLYFPIVLGLIGTTFAVIRVFKRSLQSEEYALLLLSLMTLTTSIQGFSRFHKSHSIPEVVFGILVLSYLLSAGKKGTRAAYRLAGAVVVFSLIAMMPAMLVDSAKAVSLYPPWYCDLTLPQSECTPISSDKARAVASILALTSDDEPVYVGLTRHDKLFAQDFGFYDLIDRPIPTGNYHVEPGAGTTVAHQGKIVDDLEKTHTNWIALVDWPESNEPNLSSVSHGVHLLDEYIRENFEMVEQYGAYSIHKRISK